MVRPRWTGAGVPLSYQPALRQVRPCEVATSEPRGEIRAGSGSSRRGFFGSQEGRIILEANGVRRLGDPPGGAVDNPLRHAARNDPHQLLEQPADDRPPFS